LFDFLFTGTIAGVVVGSFAIVTTVIGVVLVAVCVLRHKRYYNAVD